MDTKDTGLVSAEEARGLLDKATPGPWQARYANGYGCVAWPHGWVLDGERPPEYEEADARLAAASPDLARTVIALHARAERAERERDTLAKRFDRACKTIKEERAMYDVVQAERDRLARILAVERGDESQAPEGWRKGASWFRVGDPICAAMSADLPGGGQGWRWDLNDGPHGYAATALEAMEAADAAREVTRG